MSTPVLLINAIVVKVRGSQVANRPVYVALGVNLEGERDVLGLWLGPSGGEGAKQWMTMLTELKNRGVADALVVCCDGLSRQTDSPPGGCARRETVCSSGSRVTFPISLAVLVGMHTPTVVLISPG